MGKQDSKAVKTVEIHPDDILIFRRVHGFPKYWVSEHGHVLGQNGQSLRPYPSNGYLVVKLRSGNGEPRPRYVHQLVLEAFKGPRPSPKHQAMHLDGTRQNNRASNLEWGTQSDNEFCKVVHGTVARPDGKPKFTDDEVRLIRHRYAGPKELQVSLYQLAREYRVSVPTIWNLVRGKSYKHVSDGEA